jgi:hypothetical protein
MDKNLIFEANPSLDCFYETTDSSCFFTENAAEAHAKTLKDKKVNFVHKSSSTTETEQVNDPSESELAKQIEVVAEVLEPTAPLVETEKVEPNVVPIAEKPNTKK